MRIVTVSGLLMVIAWLLPLPGIGSDAPAIPKTWDAHALETLEVPPASLGAKVVRVTPEYYYSIPVRTIYRGYPVYTLDREPPNYLAELREKEPEVVFDASSLRTPEDWVNAGRHVFEAPVLFGVMNERTIVRNPAWWKEVAPPVSKDGVLHAYTYVVRKKGEVELGMNACSSCHTRVLPDFTVVAGAQGNFPRNRSDAFQARDRIQRAPDRTKLRASIKDGMRLMFGTPWLTPNPLDPLDQLSLEELVELEWTIPPGVMARHGTSFRYPVQVPDLIGVADRKYLDRTGLQRHRDIGDMMRYAALNQGIDFFTTFGDFMPFGSLWEPNRMFRYSDEQLYALARYIYALKPPPNPNKTDALSARGKQVFEREECDRCHKPPLYTSNKLTPVLGFRVPAQHRALYDIEKKVVGTDPGLALQTRRGTGYYKVPSLLGVWYRGPFEHSGSVSTLEDWFDPRRLRPDYVPTGFPGLGRGPRPVPGHEFGLDLSEKDKKALIAFLRTL
jgi:hypothetical protein